MTVFLLFINKNMAFSDFLQNIIGAPNKWQQAAFDKASQQYWDENFNVSSPLYKVPADEQQQLDNTYKTAEREQYQPGWTNGQNDEALKAKLSGTNTQTNTPTNTNNGGTSQQDIINAYRKMGWNDVNAILADYAATGGSKISGGSGGGVDLNAQLRSQIESGYDSYINDLNNLYSGLNTQAGSQNTIAQNSYNQSIKDLLANKESSLGDLGLTEQKLQANQVKNLRDIASNIQNQYMAGNVMLGARGAGDSSAANQYSYALNRLGSKERGNVMNTTAQSQQEIENQKAKLNNIVTQETSRLDTELANVKQGISSWLAEQQNAVSQMISQGKLNKSKEIASLTQNLLNQALSAYQTKQQEIAGRKSALESWAMSNANNIKQLQANMGAIGQFAPTMAQARSLNGSVSMDAQGNIRGLYGYGASDEDKNNYFG